MNWRTFRAMLARDAHVARRNLVPLLLQNLIQPMLFVFVFGQVMTRSGLMPQTYKNLLLPGIMALAMVLSGMQAVAMPLIAEFQFTREIEDRLLAPIHIRWVAVEKVAAGVVQALVAGLVVIPAAWLLLRPMPLAVSNIGEFAAIAVLVAWFSAAAGLALGCSVGQTQIGLMYSLVIGPMIFFGCAYYPWSALRPFPILQKLVLANPLVYASEGLRSTLAPGFPHLPAAAVLAGLVFFDVFLLALGLRQFHRKALS